MVEQWFPKGATLLLREKHIELKLSLFSIACTWFYFLNKTWDLAFSLTTLEQSSGSSWTLSQDETKKQSFFDKEPVCFLDLKTRKPNSIKRKIAWLFLKKNRNTTAERFAIASSTRQIFASQPEWTLFFCRAKQRAWFYAELRSSAKQSIAKALFRLPKPCCGKARLFSFYLWFIDVAPLICRVAWYTDLLLLFITR